MEGQISFDMSVFSTVELGVKNVMEHGQGDLHVMSLPLKTQEHLQYFYCSPRFLAQECYVNEMMGRAPPFVMCMMSRLFAAKLKP